MRLKPLENTGTAARGRQMRRQGRRSVCRHAYFTSAPLDKADPTTSETKNVSLTCTVHMREVFASATGKIHNEYAIAFGDFNVFEIRLSTTSVLSRNCSGGTKTHNIIRCWVRVRAGSPCLKSASAEKEYGIHQRVQVVYLQNVCFRPSTAAKD
eukprot:9499791-Pyramimonas_sp.AAC.3